MCLACVLKLSLLRYAVIFKRFASKSITLTCLQPQVFMNCVLFLLPAQGERLFAISLTDPLICNSDARALKLHLKHASLRRPVPSKHLILITDAPFIGAYVLLNTVQTCHLYLIKADGRRTNTVILDPYHLTGCSSVIRSIWNY